MYQVSYATVLVVLALGCPSFVLLLLRSRLGKYQLCFCFFRREPDWDWGGVGEPFV